MKRLKKTKMVWHWRLLSYQNSCRVEQTGLVALAFQFIRLQSQHPIAKWRTWRKENMGIRVSSNHPSSPPRNDDDEAQKKSQQSVLSSFHSIVGQVSGNSNCGPWHRVRRVLLQSQRPQRSSSILQSPMVLVSRSISYQPQIV